MSVPVMLTVSSTVGLHRFLKSHIQFPPAFSYSVTRNASVRWTKWDQSYCVTDTTVFWSEEGGPWTVISQNMLRIMSLLMLAWGSKLMFVFFEFTVAKWLQSRCNSFYNTLNSLERHALLWILKKCFRISNILLPTYMYIYLTLTYWF